MSIERTIEDTKQYQEFLHRLKAYHSDKLGPVTIPAPDETDNPQWVRSELALEIQEQRDELLAAGKAALIRLDRLDDAATGEHSPAYLRLQAAIRKAKGRTQ